MAAHRGHIGVVKLLVENDAKVNVKCELGWTALHIAAWHSEKEVAYFLLKHGAVAVIANNAGRTPLDCALRPKQGEPDVELICKMLLPSGALIQLATDVVEAHEKRQTRRQRIALGLRRAVESQGFLTDLADKLADIDASGCVSGTGAMLKPLLRQLDAFAKGAGDGAGAQATSRASKRRRLGTP